MLVCIWLRFRCFHDSAKIWDAFKKHLEAVVKQQSFDFFNDDGIKAFIRHLRVNANMQENSVQKHYLNLRWFLKKIEAYKEDRETGESGFTLAGILMFGNENALHDARPC